MNIFCIRFNKLIKLSITLFVVTFFAAFASHAEENKQGFISDDLTIFMHAGPGTNYRILGTINAGSEVEITGKKENEYSEILDEKNRLTWVETKYITDQPGLRFVVADLNNKLSSGSDYSAQLDGELNGLKNSLNLVNQEKESLQTELTKAQQALQLVQSKLKGQDTEIKKQWFFNGAIVLGIGLVLGLVLPRFFARRRSSMEKWG
jgi:SH3 domain protein